MDVNAELPPQLEWYQNQIAGHLPSVVRNGVRQIGILRERGRTDVILKLIQDGSRGERELKLYLRVEEILQRGQRDERDEEEAVLRELGQLIPQFRGHRRILLDEKGPPRDFLQLEDVTEKFKCPCIMDVKMGRVSADPLASVEKRLAEEVKSPLQKKIGFRILGHKVQNEDGILLSRDRIWGRERSEESIKEAFVEYLTTARLADSSIVVDAFIERLNRIRFWFERQKIIHFFASSLLFVYEGHSQAPPIVHLCMIDFSHVFFRLKTKPEKDDNYLLGLINLIQIFCDIRKDLLVSRLAQEQG